MEGNIQGFIQKKDRGMDSFKRSMRRSIRRGKGKGAWTAVLRGVLIASSMTVIAIAAFALILNWWDASDRAITAINQVVKFVSILAGVASALGSAGEGGALRGCCVGLLYMAAGIICYSLMMGSAPYAVGYMADLGMGIAAGGLFGMILTNGEKR